MADREEVLLIYDVEPTKDFPFEHIEVTCFYSKDRHAILLMTQPYSIERRESYSMKRTEPFRNRFYVADPMHRFNKKVFDRVARVQIKANLCAMIDKYVDAYNLKVLRKTYTAYYLESEADEVIVPTTA